MYKKTSSVTGHGVNDDDPVVTLMKKSSVKKC